jgi:major membrane immunogen (membrane-anchored lipoprotein)
MNRAVSIALAIVLGAALVGCSKQEQAAETNKNGKYAGKPDTRPWESEKTAFTDAKLNKGDKAAWETAIKARNQAQNEYTKTQ